MQVHFAANLHSRTFRILQWWMLLYRYIRTLTYGINLSNKQFPIPLYSVQISEQQKQPYIRLPEFVTKHYKQFPKRQALQRRWLSKLNSYNTWMLHFPIFVYLHVQCMCSNEMQICCSTLFVCWDTLLHSSPAGHIYELLATNDVVDESHDNGGYVCCLWYLLSNCQVYCTLQTKDCLVSHIRGSSHEQTPHKGGLCDRRNLDLPLCLSIVLAPTTNISSVFHMRMMRWPAPYFIHKISLMLCA